MYSPAPMGINCSPSMHAVLPVCLSVCISLSLFFPLFLPPSRSPSLSLALTLGEPVGACGSGAVRVRRRLARWFSVAPTINKRSAEQRTQAPTHEIYCGSIATPPGFGPPQPSHVCRFRRPGRVVRPCVRQARSRDLNSKVYLPVFANELLLHEAQGQMIPSCIFLTVSG